MFSGARPPTSPQVTWVDARPRPVRDQAAPSGVPTRSHLRAVTVRVPRPPYLGDDQRLSVLAAALQGEAPRGAAAQLHLHQATAVGRPHLGLGQALGPRAGLGTLHGAGRGDGSPLSPPGPPGPRPCTPGSTGRPRTREASSARAATAAASGELKLQLRRKVPAGACSEPGARAAQRAGEAGPAGAGRRGGAGSGGAGGQGAELGARSGPARSLEGGRSGSSGALWDPRGRQGAGAEAPGVPRLPRGGGVRAQGTSRRGQGHGRGARARTPALFRGAGARARCPNLAPPGARRGGGRSARPGLRAAQSGQGRAGGGGREFWPLVPRPYQATREAEPRQVRRRERPQPTTASILARAASPVPPPLFSRATGCRAGEAGGAAGAPCGPDGGPAWKRGRTLWPRAGLGQEPSARALAGPSAKRSEGSGRRKTLGWSRGNCPATPRSSPAVPSPDEEVLLLGSS